MNNKTQAHLKDVLLRSAWICKASNVLLFFMMWGNIQRKLVGTIANN